ncbi:MAG TPA: hypothetical protein VFE14_03890, partial [Micromonosporaceae bacterium]|nr:hypothetical protein [Micromonosporaceae bacterium]
RSRLVIKTVVSAGGRRAWLAETPEQARAVLLREAPNEPALVQAYEPAIVDSGEYSAIFLAGELSHAVLKLPQRGEFRVQEHFGGRTEAVQGARWMAEYGRRVLDELPEVPGYARVDFVVDAAGEPKLMELELIEPDLFLRYAPESYSRLADLLLRSRT